MPQDKQCCKFCNCYTASVLSCSPIHCHNPNCPHCHTPTSPKTWKAGMWRENLHRTIQEIMYPKKGADGKFLMKIPSVIIDAIDAAYTAGLDDREKMVSKTEEEILKELENKVVDIIFNREAGWSEVLNIELSKALSQAFKAGEALGQQKGYMEGYAES